MADGAASHKLGAAENQLTIDYWMTDDTATLTPESAPILRLSATVAGSGASKAIKITRFNARIDATGTVLANDTGDFAIDAPHSYSSSIVIPGKAPDRATRIIFTFDLLTETAPGTGIFTRQTITDDLALAFTLQAPPPAPPVTPLPMAGASPLQG
jgi:hypothetical protein